MLCIMYLSLTLSKNTHSLGAYTYCCCTHLAKNNHKGEQTHCIPEGVRLEPLKQLPANFHGVRHEGPVGQQEVFNVCGVHDRGLLYQVHDQTLWGSLRVVKQAYTHDIEERHHTHAHITANYSSTEAQT